MSSSISSSSAALAAAAVVAPSRIGRVLLVLALALLGLEAVTRLKLFHLSKDFVQFATYPERAAALARRDGIRIAVVGNSITHEDIDPTALAERLRALTGRRAHADIFSADHSYINTWHYMLARYFWKPGDRVDLVVVPFWGANLADGNETEIGRLAQFFTTLDDWPSVLTGDLTSNAERADFIVSSGWATFAARDRMRELVFTVGLPDYKGYARREQDVLVNHLAVTAAARPKQARTSHTLKRLLREARQHGTPLVFIAFPTLHAEWSDTYADVARLINEAGMHYLDLRGMPDVDESSYVDLVHMNETGRAAFTRRLAESLVPLLRCAGPGCHAITATVEPAPAGAAVVAE